VPKPTSLLGLYRAQVYPIVSAAGFTGTVAVSTRKVGRGQFWVRAMSKNGGLAVRIEGSGDRGQALIPFEQVLASSGDRGKAIATLARRMRKELAGLDQYVSPVARPVRSLGDALRAWIERKQQAHGGVSLREIEQRGRTFVVRTAKRELDVDRTCLITLMHELWGDHPFHRVRPRYAAQDEEANVYIGHLAHASKAEARALYLHLYTPYSTYAAPGSPLAKLFPKPHPMSKTLNEGASASSLIARAIPYATKGTLVDRAGALAIIDNALSSMHESDRQWARVVGDLRKLAAKLERDRAPLLQEAGRLLERGLGKIA
jgi:hypothetical protein